MADHGASRNGRSHYVATTGTSSDRIGTTAGSMEFLRNMSRLFLTKGWPRWLGQGSGGFERTLVDGMIKSSSAGESRHHPIWSSYRAPVVFQGKSRWLIHKQNKGNSHPCPSPFGDGTNWLRGRDIWTSKNPTLSFVKYHKRDWEHREGT
jgi:hypothetical protein